LLRELRGREFKFFITSLVEQGNLNDRKKDGVVKRLQDRAKVFLEEFEVVAGLYEMDSSRGREIARASFNLNAINKISKNFDQEFSNLKKEKEEIFNFTKTDTDLFKRVDFKDLDKSTPEVYSLLKDFKAREKSRFLELISQGKIKDLKSGNIPPLFKDIKINKWEKNTNKEIFSYDIFKNFLNEKDKKKRGKYFTIRFNNYIEINNVFKRVAIKNGELKAKERSIEQEKREALLLQYWAIILESENTKSLVLIPKDKAQKANLFLRDFESLENGKDTVISFSSLTLRALEKLIRRNLGKEVPLLSDEDEQKAIILYKRVLRGDFPMLKNIGIDGFDNDIEKLLNQDFASKEDFRIALEKVAYITKRIKIDHSTLERFKNNFSVIVSEITAYDWKRNIATERKKEHTKIWEEFWGDKNQNGFFPNRINPEVRLFYRPILKQEDPKKQQNRFSKEHFGVAFTISQNAAKERMVTTFSEAKDLKAVVEKFNQEEILNNFVKKQGDNLWYFGIDRGNTELASLCVVKFSDEDYEESLQNRVVVQKKPIPALIKAYRIRDLKAEREIVIDKDQNTKVVSIYKNPSYFIDELDKYFEEVNSPCMDLTMAKLIKGKIILDGDRQTYLKLKMINGKRQLKEKFGSIDPTAQIELLENNKNKSDRKFRVKSKTGERYPYQFLPFFTAEHEKTISTEEFRLELQNYLDKLRKGEKEDEEISIEKINHLRDSLTSNMVGIIAHLFEQFPGIINLENLHKEREIESHFSSNNENLARRLEWSLYKKFQKLGLVPPQLKQTVMLRRDDKKKEGNKDGLNQFGIIHFIETKGTSARCPVCEHEKSGEERKEEKFSRHTYSCNQCGFTTDDPKAPFEFLKDSDATAAFNIAKKKLNY